MKHRFAILEVFDFKKHLLLQIGMRENGVAPVPKTVGVALVVQTAKVTYIHAAKKNRISLVR